MAAQTGQDKSQELFEDVGKKVEKLQLEHEGADTSGIGDGHDADDRVVDEIESLCMNCHENGTTRLLLTRIPYFREVILMSFSCPHCNLQNSEIQSAGQIQEHGCRYNFTLSGKSDLSRQVVKSDSSIVKFVELDVEIPAGRGRLTNVEGLLTGLIEDLEFEQPARRSLNSDLHAKIEEVLSKGRKMLEGERFPFTMILDDPAGNSWVEPSMEKHDGRLARSEYKRTAEQNEALSLSGSGTDTAGPKVSGMQTRAAPNLQEGNGDDNNFTSEIVPDEVYSFPTSCPGCSKSCVTHMKMVNIPHFKEVVIMSTVCDHCGYRTNEIKTGGALPSMGRRIVLRVRNPEDLARDILKSETCAIFSPELSLTVQPGTLGGRFTTVEGLLTQVRDDLRAQIFDVGDEDEDEKGGDSVPAKQRERWGKFFAQMEKAIKGEMNFSIVLEDPWASSYVQSLCAPDDDPQLVVEDYERTEEENEELGLNDINLEDYTEEVKAVESIDPDKKQPYKETTDVEAEAPGSVA
ncbi:MAG: nucleolar zinc-finger protein [Peltula sp. TS41687]|nr:MAG: nucleolar zinc-finger protein [Peltula sp. TS41687]